jgi:hypothetical protein
MCASRFLKTYRKPVLLAILAMLILGLLAVAAVGLARPSDVLLSQKSAKSADSLSQQPSAAASEVPLPKMVKEPPDIGGDQIASLEEAQSRVNFKILVPRNAAQGFTLARIGVRPVSTALGNFGILSLKYSGGGREFQIWQRSDGTDMGSVDELLPKWPGFQKVDINGCAGVGHEKSSQTVRGETLPVPASVEWWCDGVVRTVLSYDLSLAEVQAIAESMK